MHQVGKKHTYTKTIVKLKELEELIEKVYGNKIDFSCGLTIYPSYWSQEFHVKKTGGTVRDLRWFNKWKKNPEEHEEMASDNMKLFLEDMVNHDHIESGIYLIVSNSYD